MVVELLHLVVKKYHYRIPEGTSHIGVTITHIGKGELIQKFT